eukprot:1148524-Pelagomonas_calceolata.AAC.1
MAYVMMVQRSALVTSCCRPWIRCCPLCERTALISCVPFGTESLLCPPGQSHLIRRGVRRKKPSRRRKSGCVCASSRCACVRSNCKCARRSSRCAFASH